ncbi:MAG: inorganic pyrophosphatase Ppa [Desulfobulbaceae bacterium]|jgi:hypothetical protein|nr:inorganic pyrophosphatase Ppa [Desulfobulbaceae bacterium]
MPLRQFPDAVKEFALQVYERPMDETEFYENHIAFTGAPQKHFFDHEKVVLVVDPFSFNTSYYEFKTSDISYVEELQTTVDKNGLAINIVRIWVKKLAIGIRSTPFVVADTRF